MRNVVESILSVPSFREKHEVLVTVECLEGGSVFDQRFLMEDGVWYPDLREGVSHAFLHTTK